MKLVISDKTGKRLSISELDQKIQTRVSTVFMEIMVFFLHLVGHIPFHNFRRFFYRLFGMKIGKESTIHMGLRLYNPANINIGTDSIIGENSILDGRAKLFIGNHVDIASEVMVYNSEHNVNSEHFAAVENIIEEPVTIENYVFIGPRAIILPGVKIGKGAIVGAGAVVTKDLPPYAIAGGVPAKIIGERRNKELHYKLGRAAWFR